MDILTKEHLLAMLKEKHNYTEHMEYLKFCREFVRQEYSEGNKYLVRRQNKDATETRGFLERKNKGRIVRKGEHAIRILAGSVIEDEDSNVVKKRFKVIPVFDISQTDAFNL